MTVPTTTNKVIGTGNGVTTVFPFTFGTLPSGDLVVTLFDTDGIEYPQAEATNYTVSGKGEEDGGSVTFLVAPSNGWTVLIQRVLPETQPTDLKNQGSFYPRTIERMFDRVTFLVQQLAERVASALTLPPQVEGVSLQLPAPAPSTLFGWNSSGNAIENFPLSTIATQITYGDKNYQVFTGTGAQVNFTLSQNPGSIGNLDVSIDGVTQVPIADYTYDGTVLTFTTAPASSAVILVRFDVAVPVGTGLASAINFRQGGAGAILRASQDKMREYVTPEDFGAIGDGVSNDRAPMLAAANYCLSTGSRLRLASGKTYFVGTTTTLTFPAIDIDPENGSLITGNVDLKTTARFVRPLTVTRQDASDTYIPYDFIPEVARRTTQVPVFQGEGDLNRSVVGAITMSGMTHERLAWPAGTSWASFVPGTSGADAVGTAITNDGFFYGHFQAAEGGAEYNATFEDVVCTRALMLRCTDGVRMFYCQQDGDGTITFKSLAGAPVTISSGITWEGKGDHLSWLPSNSEWTIRLYDLRTWSVLLNGREVVPPQTLPAGHFIDLVGFGYAYDGANVTPLVRYGTKVVNRQTNGRGMLDLIFVGDSTTASIHGDYPTFIRDYIDASCGIKLSRIRNYAQDGATSAIQLSTLTTNGVLGATDVIVNLGTNDVQNPGAAGDLAACLANMTSIIDYCQAANKRVTGVIFPTWYPKTLAGNKGVTTFNYDLSALYRSAYRNLFAKKGCQIVDLNMELRSALGSDLSSTTIDPALRDNIHPTPRRAAAIAWAVARKLVGYAPQKTRALTSVSLPAGILLNSWTVVGGAEIGMTGDALVNLSGRIDGGTKTDGTQIMRLPASVVPRIQQVFRLRTDAGNAATIIVATTGIVTVFNMGADSGIYLDGITYFAR